MEVYKYPQFTEDEIIELVHSRADYNTGGLSFNRPPFYEGFIGKAFSIVLDNGNIFDYTFEDIHTLRWSMPGRIDVSEEYYDALKADEEVILLVHIIKGSRPQQSRIISIDLETKLVTAFLCKIGNEVSTREVDRDIVFGYLLGEGEPPAERHSITTELVGKSILWTYTPEFTIQHLYASPSYSCFVDFNTFYGGLVLSSPTNYVKLNDHIYIYSWIETEGAGVQGFALMNLHEMHDVGCFFGINGSSQFECYTFGAIGNYVGQLSNSDLYLDNNDDGRLKPYRLRTQTAVLSEDEVLQAVGASQDYSSGERSGNRPAFSPALAGKILDLHFDNGGPNLHYEFASEHELIWKEKEREHREYYDVLKIDKNAFLISHLRIDAEKPVAVNLAIDLKMNLATLILTTIGTSYSPRETSSLIYFGVVNRDNLPTPLTWRHHFTRDLVGRAMAWDYGNNHKLQHVYAAPNSFTFVYLCGEHKDMLGCGPCKYVKLNDHAYLLTWTETPGSGMTSVSLINRITMQAVGSQYGINHDGRFEFSTFGARGYELGGYTTRELFKW